MLSVPQCLPTAFFISKDIKSQGWSYSIDYQFPWEFLWYSTNLGNILRTEKATSVALCTLTKKLLWTFTAVIWHMLFALWLQAFLMAQNVLHPPLAAVSIVEASSHCWDSKCPRVNQRGYLLGTTETIWWGCVTSPEEVVSKTGNLIGTKIANVSLNQGHLPFCLFRLQHAGVKPYRKPFKGFYNIWTQDQLQTNLNGL